LNNKIIDKQAYRLTYNSV